MAVVSKQYLKSQFVRGNRPTQQDYADLIDSYQNIISTALSSAGTLGIQILATDTTVQAQDLLGGTTLGKALFQVASTAAAQNLLGVQPIVVPTFSSFGEQLVSAATTAAGQFVLGASVVGVQVFSAITTAAAQSALNTATITPWVSYTPTFTGFGTVAVQSFWWRRIGDSVEIQGKFTSGTSTGVEARITLPSINSDATKVPAIRAVGSGYLSTTGALLASVLIESNVAYMTFGLQGSGSAGLSKATGSSLTAAGDIFSFFATIPISGW